MHLGGVEVDAVLLVADDGAVLPGIPQAEHDLGELAGAGVAVGMRHMRVVAEIERLGGGKRSDEIPAGAALADLVERGEEARDGERLVIGRRHGGDEADALRHRGERAEQGQRLEPGGRALANPGFHVVGAEGGVGVRREQEVELAALGGAGDLDVMREIELGMGVGVGIAPGGDVMADALEEQAELHHRGCIAHDGTLPAAFRAARAHHSAVGGRDASLRPLRRTKGRVAAAHGSEIKVRTRDRSVRGSRWPAGSFRWPCRRWPSPRRTWRRSCRPCARRRCGSRCNSRSRWSR